MAWGGLIGIDSVTPEIGLAAEQTQRRAASGQRWPLSTPVHSITLLASIRDMTPSFPAVHDA